MIGDALRFLLYNLRHYSLALWGFGQQLEPDYPKVERFFPSLVSDSVYEYRTYGGMIVFAGVIAWLPYTIVCALIGFWGARAYIRTGYFRSSYLFWRQAYREAPAKPRIKAFYMEWIVREVMWRMQHGHSSKDVEPLDRLAFQIQEEICRLPSYTDAQDMRAGAGGIGKE